MMHLGWSVVLSPCKGSVMAGGVRKIRGGQRGRKIVTRFPSLKMKQVVWGESPLELDYHSLLEFDSGVVAFQEQPFRIEYSLDGKPRFYTPDLLVLRSNGQRQVIEVKPDKDALQPENQRLYRIIQTVCARNNYLFGLALESDIRREPRLRNVKILLRYARTPIGLPQRLMCNSFFADQDQSQATVGELIHFCASRKIEPQGVYALIFRGMLCVDLHELLGPNSRVWLAKRNPPSL